MVIIFKNSEKIKANLNRENTQKGDELGFKKLFFKHNKFNQKKYKYKEIKFEKANSDFIVVPHFLAYVHSPQALNRVRVPLYLKF